MITQKTDNDKIVLIGNLLRMYENFEQVEMDDHTEFRCDMYEMHTELTLEEVDNNFDVLIAQAKETEYRKKLKTDAYVAQAYLDSTDYMVIKCAEVGLSMLEEYPMQYNKREEARQTIRDYRTTLEKV